jgi:hypothetical protein
MRGDGMTAVRDQPMGGGVFSIRAPVCPKSGQTKGSP